MLTIVTASVRLYLDQREVLAAVNLVQPSVGRTQAAAVGRCVVITLAAWGSLLSPGQHRSPDSLVELIARMGEAHDGLHTEPDSVDKFLVRFPSGKRLKSHFFFFLSSRLPLPLVHTLTARCTCAGHRSTCR